MGSNKIPKAVMTADELQEWWTLPANERRKCFEQAILEAANTPRVKPGTPEQALARVERGLRS